MMRCWRRATAFHASLLRIPTIAFVASACIVRPAHRRSNALFFIMIASNGFATFGRIRVGFGRIAKRSVFFRTLFVRLLPDGAPFQFADQETDRVIVVVLASAAALSHRPTVRHILIRAVDINRKQIFVHRRVAQLFAHLFAHLRSGHHNQRLTVLFLRKGYRRGGALELTG